jgi:hypothetical protein
MEFKGFRFGVWLGLEVFLDSVKWVLFLVGFWRSDRIFGIYEF